MAARTIDTTKYAASRYGMPMVSVATSLANDGIASPTAALDNDGVRGSYGVHIPIAVIVDLDFVTQGPPRLNRAGIGELVSQHQRAGRLGAGPRGPRRAGRRAGGRTGPDRAPRRCSTTPATVGDDAFVTVLADALISSGLAMAVCGTSPSGQRRLPRDHATPSTRCSRAPRLHGEQVGVGALFCTFLRARRGAGSPSWPACLARHGLPRTPHDVWA